MVKYQSPSQLIIEVPKGNPNSCTQVGVHNMIRANLEFQNWVVAHHCWESTLLCWNPGS